LLNHTSGLLTRYLVPTCHVGTQINTLSRSHMPCGNAELCPVDWIGCIPRFTNRLRKVFIYLVVWWYRYNS